jgi:hypothetical protein
MSDPLDLPPAPPPPDDVYRPRPAKVPLWLVVIAVFAAIGVGWLYTQVDQKGLTIRAKGHLLVLPADQGGAWALLVEGTLLKVGDESVRRLRLETGPCDDMIGSIEGELLELDSVQCSPGAPLQPAIGERIRFSGLKFSHWDKSIPFAGDTLEPYLRTPEVMAAMIDHRATAPQLVPLYNPLFPRALAELRRKGALPPPLVFHVRRDDLQLVRVTRSELSLFLNRSRLFVAGGAVEGGWLVRPVTIDDAAPATVESLLLDPRADPWPDLLKNKEVLARRATPPPAAPAPAEAASAPAQGAR